MRRTDLVTRGQKEGSHGGCQTHAHGRHVRTDVPHGVKDRHPCTAEHHVMQHSKIWGYGLNGAEIDRSAIEPPLPGTLKHRALLHFAP